MLKNFIEGANIFNHDGFVYQTCFTAVPNTEERHLLILRNICDDFLVGGRDFYAEPHLCFYG